MAYDNSIPASFLKNNIAPNSQVTIGNIDFSSAITTADGNKLAIDPTNFVDTGLGQYATFQGWTFITAPEEISWDVANQASRVDMFGTNAPPVVSGSRGMRDLTLGNALVEGFVRNVTVEGKIAALENLMNYKLSSSSGFVSVPVYQVWANEKSYGGTDAYYIIKDVKIKETMRDIKGDATRAYVDISLMEVPKYQVNSGRDQASEASTGAKSSLLSDQDLRNKNPNQAAVAKAGSAANQGIGITKPPAGPKTPPPSTPPTQQKLQGSLREIPLW